jgi:hypothetical protein
VTAAQLAARGDQSEIFTFRNHPHVSEDHAIYAVITRQRHIVAAYEPDTIAAAKNPMIWKTSAFIT